MYHICFSNPEAWKISYQKGIYGNVKTGNNNKNTFWGKLVDLIALKPGDKIFFYVKDEKKLFGLFEVISEPFYCEDDIFQNPEESYPFRFNFTEYKHFDNQIPISELAKLIESGLLFSLTTFERDQNAFFRSIRQLTNEEGLLLEKVFIGLNPKTNVNDIKTYSHPSIEIKREAIDIVNNEGYNIDLSIPNLITFNKLPVKEISRHNLVSQYEVCLQGYIHYSIRRDLNNVIKDLNVENHTEALLEVPMLKAQQFRSDILCLYREEKSKPHFYSIIEIKRDKTITIDDLSQLIGYLKTYTSSKNIMFNNIEGVYISNHFEEEAVKYLRNRKSVEKENPIRLVHYLIDENGQINFKKIDI